MMPSPVKSAAAMATGRKSFGRGTWIGGRKGGAALAHAAAKRTAAAEAEFVRRARRLRRGIAYFFLSSIRTCFATALSVSKTPRPLGALASNVGSPLKLSCL